MAALRGRLLLLLLLRRTGQAGSVRYPRERRIAVQRCINTHTAPPPGGPNGPIVYMDANPDLDIILNRIENAGGKIIKPKKAISEDHEFLTTFLDSEGNRMALHPMK